MPIPLHTTTFTIMATISHSSYYSSLFSTIFTLYILILLYFPQVFVKLLLSPLLISTLVLLLTLLRLGASQQRLKQQQQQQQQRNITQNGLEPEPGTGPRQEEEEVAKLQCNMAKAHSTMEPETCDPGRLDEVDSFSLKEKEGANTPRLIITQNVLQIPKPGYGHEPNRVETGPVQEEVGEVVKPQCNMAEARSTMEPETSYPGQLDEVDSSVNHDYKKENKACQNLDWADIEPGCGPNLLLEWDVGAPLEVIYEAYEGEEEGEEEEQNDAFCKTGILKRYPSLSRYFPESDSDSDSSSSSISSDEEEEEREGLYEIALGNYGFNNGDKRVINMLMMPTKRGDQKLVDHYFDDEDNLIEIDISPTKIMSDFSW
ncbi:uncharacterized protein [Spinacia oleracea]|uniref:Uncharacterized protein n=1 Tax=Spinacia oleracea TaxID=3562 RepID=A0A9R0JFH5_SPIOL|nr:uncharacterized protein LOC110805561 [Spinacia oleracea]